MHCSTKCCWGTVSGPKQTSPTVLHAWLWLAGVALAPGCQGCPRSRVTPAHVRAGVWHTGPASAHATTKLRSDGTLVGRTEAMGTSASVNVFVGDEGRAPLAKLAIMQAFEAMARVEDIMSEWRRGSTLSQLNRLAGTGRWLTVGDDLFDLLARSVELARETEGAFDPTFFSVGRLWNFEPGARPPDAKAVAAARAALSYRNIELNADGARVRLTHADTRVGLGAIAKGFAVDRAVDVLRAHGFANAVIEAGGDTYALGTKDGQPWQVGIAQRDGPGVLAAVRLVNRAAVTSGTHARFFVDAGIHYAHILNPHTGWPVLANESPKSVTLLAPRATEADAYCTAVMVMGREGGLAFVEARPDLEAVVIDADGSVHVSSGLAAELVWPDVTPGR